MHDAGFQADPRRINAFGSRIAELQDDAEMAKIYAARHLDLGDRGGHMFLSVKRTADQLLDSLVANYDRLARVAMESGAELQQAAALYRRTDQTHARRIGATTRAK